MFSLSKSISISKIFATTFAVVLIFAGVISAFAPISASADMKTIKCQEKYKYCQEGIKQEKAKNKLKTEANKKILKVKIGESMPSHIRNIGSDRYPRLQLIKSEPQTFQISSISTDKPVNPTERTFKIN